MYDSNISDSGFAFENVILSDANTEALVIDDAHLLFAGDYTRSGDDLLITSEINQVTIIDYFGSDIGPDLRNADGANLSFNAVKALAGPESPAAYAVEGDVGADLVEIGNVISLSGEAFSKSINGIEVELKIGDPVFEGDVVRTGSDSDLGITFVDKTVFSLSSNATMILDELVYSAGDDANNSMAFNLVQGAFVFVTGEIAPTGNMSIETPVATMGIRGTTPTVIINTVLGVTEFSILPDPGSEKVGSYVLVSKLDGQIVATVDSVGSKWVLTSLTGDAVEVGKSGIDLLEDTVTLDKIREVFSAAFSDRTDIDGANSFGQVLSQYLQTDDANNEESDDFRAEEVSIETATSDFGGSTDNPPKAFDDFFTIGRDSALTNANVISGGGSKSDYDPDGSAVKVTHVDGNSLTFIKPADGEAFASVVLESGALLLITADGDITYDANDKFDFLGRGESADDHFTYTIRDPGGSTATANVTITITGSENYSPRIIDATTVAGELNETTDDVNSPESKLTTGGSFLVGDADTTDVVTITDISAAIDDNSGDLHLPTEAVLLNMLNLAIGDEIISNTVDEGVVNWTFDTASNPAAFEYLAEGESIEITYKVTINDDFVPAGNTTQDIVITITGTNDAPVITAGVVSGTVDDVAEAADENPAGSWGDLSTVGSITFDDVDLTDRPVATEATKSVTITSPADAEVQATLTDDQKQVIEDAFTIENVVGNTNNGTINWDYTIAESAIDFLGEGETVTVVFTITVTDDEGATDTQDVTITINGTGTDVGDAPVITAGVVSGTVDDVAEAADENPAGSWGDLSTVGSITFDDVDLTDRPVATEATKSVTITSPADAEVQATLTDDQKQVIEDAFTIENVVGNTNNGTINWDYTIAESAIDFLGEGETVTVVFTITVTDDEGATDTQDVTITINGTGTDVGDAPVITAGVVSGTVDDVAEAADENPAGSWGDLSTVGSITFDDVDLTDRPVATEATKSVTITSPADAEVQATLTDDQKQVIEDAFTIENVVGNTNNGTINWDYTIAESAIDFLDEGETVTVVFTITVTDDEGATDTQDVTITINGTGTDVGDAPVITAGVVSGTVDDVAEAADENPAGSWGDLSTVGSITFDDVDLTDRPVATEATKSVTITSPADAEVQATLTDDQKQVIEDAFTIENVVGNTNNGIINWDYTIAESAIDFLGEGETVTVVFTITVTDDEGATDTQDVTITINGTGTDVGDAPVITAGVVSGTVDDVAEAADENPAGSWGDLSTVGSITFDDVDLTDRPVATEATKSVTITSPADAEVQATLTDDQKQVIEDAFTIENVVGNTNNGTINWDYTIAESAIDFLGEGETVTVVFTITVTDDEGATDTQDVTITINGTGTDVGDAPVITAGVVSGTVDDVAEAADENPAGSWGDLSTVGSITFDDVDLTDRPVATEATKSVTITSPADAEVQATLTDDQKQVIEDAFTIENVVGNTNNGIINWDYTIAESAIDFLGEGETVTVVFTITVTDDEGATDTQDVTITINGTGTDVGDAPVITAGVVSGTVDDVAEAADENPAGSWGDLSTVGSITFDDVDLTDRPVATEATKSVTITSPADAEVQATLTDDQKQVIEDAFTIENVVGNTNNGIINWDYTIAESAIDFLGEGETVTVVFTITVTDDEGATDTQDVTITINGTGTDVGDAPVITAGVVSGTVDDVAEAADENPAGSWGDLSTVGSITFDDVDLTDRPVATEATKSVTITSPADAEVQATLTDDQKQVIEDAFTIENVVGNTNNGIINWDYTIAESAIDFLGEGERIRAVFTITVTDDEGATDTQDVTITLVGTNDDPVIVAGVVSSEMQEGNSGLIATGSFAVNDVDTTDVVTISEITVSATALDGEPSLPDNGYLLAMLTLENVEPIIDGTVNDGTVNWQFDAAAGFFDYLDVNESIEITYTVTVTDGNGGTAEQDIMITIIGEAETYNVIKGDGSSETLTGTIGADEFALVGNMPAFPVDTIIDYGVEDIISFNNNILNNVLQAARNDPDFDGNISELITFIDDVEGDAVDGVVMQLGGVNMVIFGPDSGTSSPGLVSGDIVSVVNFDGTIQQVTYTEMVAVAS